MELMSGKSRITKLDFYINFAFLTVFLAPGRSADYVHNEKLVLSFSVAKYNCTQ